ncbi:MAG: cysteine--tRNA ligase [Calditrichaceae bacterium]|nr:cysteine--tRNA ligase [Calditrichia bacterium]NUQ40303.1 cysteine--tRNA ligase [Calditrichaceae bacterium]
MSLQIYNSLTRQKEEFIPLQPGRVHIYVCGPTVYSHAHIGHAKSYISFDVVVRYFRYLGYRVKYVQNITDVGHLLGDADEGEDRILKKAREEQLDPMEVAQMYTWSYFDDMAALGVLRPDISPHASGHIIEQIELVKILLEKGYAYESNGSVYFDVHKFPEYGQLSGRKVEELEAGSRVEVNPEKRHPADFALWKKAEPNHLMKWPGPWSVGYPGWHIECSAMSMKYLGETFDIHGGGLDNIFPHHECEIAQSVAATGKPFARYWMHNNMISLSGEKMSKSLGNVWNIKDVVKNYSSLAIRHFILSSHYRSRLEYSEEALKAAEQGSHRLLNAVEKLQEALRAAAEGEIFSAPFSPEDYRRRFEEAMNDDFNTARAMAALFDLAKASNQYLAETPAPHKPFLVEIEQLFKTLGHEVLGILPAEIGAGAGAVSGELVEKLMILNLDVRNQLRKQKNWALADQIRNELQKAGVILEDRPDGTTGWSREK